MEGRLAALVLRVHCRLGVEQRLDDGDRRERQGGGVVVQGRVARLVLRVEVLAVVDQGANLVRALGEVEFLESG